MRSTTRLLRPVRLLAAALSIVAMLPASPETRVAKPPPAIEDLVLAELAFARASVENGMREAFLAYLAEDAVIFRPGPVPARTWFEELPPVPGRLSWEPLFADVSLSGDLGYTTGPWQFLPASDAGAGGEPSYGHYVSIWARGGDESWRVIVDLGNNHPRIDGTVGDLGYPSRRGGSGNRRAGSGTDPGEELLDADGRFAENSAASGTGEACKEFAADEIRVYRSNRAPTTGKGKACTELAGTGERVASQPMGSGLARTGDLGYVFGNLEFIAGSDGSLEEEAGPSAGASSSQRPAGQGSFLRIWKSNRDGAWLLVLDISILHPAATAAGAKPSGDGS